MDKKTTFTLEDLTEEFFGKLIFVERSKIDTCGMAPPGRILMITEEGEEYFLGCEGYDEFRPALTVPLLKVDRRDIKANRIFYCAEKEGWTYTKGFSSDVLIRDDYYDKVMEIFKSNKELLVISGAVVKMFDPEYKSGPHTIPGFVYVKTQERFDKEDQWREHQLTIRLTEEDILWKPIYSGSEVEGEFAFLFRKNEDRTISGGKWTIMYQCKETEDHYIDMHAPFEAYNLFYRRYDDVAGVLGYEEKLEPDNGRSIDYNCYKYSTIQGGLWDLGEFVRSYGTLEKAKESVLFRNSTIGWGMVDQENIIRVKFDEESVREMEQDFFRKTKRQKELLLLFSENYDLFFRQLAEHEQPGDVAFDISRELGISRDDVYRMWKTTPLMCCKKELEFARDIVAGGGHAE